MTPNFSKETLQEMVRLINLTDGLEHGFILFNKNNEICHGEESVGTKNYLELNYEGYKNIIGLFHTHPNTNIISPSLADFDYPVKLMCLGINYLKRIVCYEKRIPIDYINNRIHNYFCKRNMIEYKLNQKYSFKNLENYGEFRNALIDNPIYFKHLIESSKNISSMCHKYEINIETLIIKNIGYKQICKLNPKK